MTEKRRRCEVVKHQITNVLYAQLEGALLVDAGLSGPEGRAKFETLTGRELLALSETARNKPKSRDAAVFNLMLLYGDPNRHSREVAALFESMLGVEFDSKSGVSWRAAKRHRS